MNITEETYGSTLILTCKGELTEDSLDAFKQVIERYFPPSDHTNDRENHFHSPKNHDRNQAESNSPTLEQSGNSNVNPPQTTPPVRGLVLDLKAVPFIDSAGLEYLLDLRDRISERLGEIKLVNVDENVSKILEITRLDGAFEQFDNITEAVRSI
ncbi:MAG: STAS domain-containing protein [Planctomycetes bacterium]|nr:STAS domain-containing protein [Planctomycetota bacterium]